VSWEPFEIDPRAGILEAVIEINASLVHIREDIGVIRRILEGGDGEEAEDDA
jgi:hypothetical protein